ncbi:FBP domain-containing protein [Microbacterium halophytorum]|uniref:FBP domain-containing protein n=1 Tax=Microbacterium halophytorum TaxID=2067568 RepID=UPI002D78B61E|nr:FBP domain-containing protein [Microbacterium halophytorum]
MTEHEVFDAFANATDEELRIASLPHDFPLVEWDHTDFLAWADPHARGRGYIAAEVDGDVTAIVLRRANGTSGVRQSFCNLCRTMQPGNQVALFTARRAGGEGVHGNSIGTYICADLSCHENVRLAMPLAPNEYRTSVDMKIDNTAKRVRRFVAQVLGA